MSGIKIGYRITRTSVAAIELFFSFRSRPTLKMMHDLFFISFFKTYFVEKRIRRYQSFLISPNVNCKKVKRRFSFGLILLKLTSHAFTTGNTRNCSRSVNQSYEDKRPAKRECS